MVNRLKPIMPSLISPEQGAFVLGGVLLSYTSGLGGQALIAKSSKNEWSGGYEAR